MTICGGGDVKFLELRDLELVITRNEELQKRTIFAARPLVGVITIPIGSAQVGRSGYRYGLRAISQSTIIGTTNITDFPSPVAMH